MQYNPLTTTLSSKMLSAAITNKSTAIPIVKTPTPAIIGNQ